MDVSDWLRELGLERYEPGFRDNEIDWDVLPELTEGDLEKLGLPLGPRKKLLKAIAALRAAPAQDGIRPARPSPDSSPAPPRDAERRQLTVMFVDLVGSTELSRRLDPEDMSGVMRAYQGCASQVIPRWGGHIAKYLGDGVLAYFGWPQAHEDDAERAVRAGLGVAQDVAEVGDGAGGKLAVRIGIATGPVVVGELIGEGAAQEQAVVGETPNLAARLQALAVPGGVVISHATRRLLGALFDLADLGPQLLKGFAEPLSAWRVEAEAAAESRFEALHGRRLTPLVGREHELGLLLDRWSRARDGEGQVVLLSGEPGIGKSRLIQALRERLREEPHVVLPHYGSAHHTSSAFHPIIRHLERAAGFARDDPSEVQLNKLEALVGRASDRLDEDVLLLAALLGIPAGERYPALTLTPEVQKRRTLEALVDRVAALAAQQPVLALYEDVHWIDPSTLEFVGLVIERIQQLPVVVLITFRPELQPPWTGQAHVTTLTMTRLGRRQSADLVARVTRDKPLPTALVEQIVARTDGVPLFVEELTRTVLESGLLVDGGDRWAMSCPLPPLAIPSSLHDSLMARLDRSTAARGVAQIASVVGREFPVWLLAAVAGRAAASIESALAQLESAELVYHRGVPPDTTYTFKHALVQDAAYHSLLRSRRQQLHLKIANVLESSSEQMAEREPEVLAQHLTRGGAGERAIDYWQRAGKMAAERSACLEACKHMHEALALVRVLPAGTRRDQLELDLQSMLSRPLVAARGYAAKEVKQTYRRACLLADKLGNIHAYFDALRGLWNVELDQGRLPHALRLAEKLKVLAQEDVKKMRVALAGRALGTTLYFMGRFREALTDLERAAQVAPDCVDRGYGEDPAATAKTYTALVLQFMGYPDKALARMNEALSAAADPHSSAFVLFFYSRLQAERRNPAETFRQVSECRSLAEQYGFPQWAALATFPEGRALLEVDDVQMAIATLERAIGAWRNVQGGASATSQLGSLAEAYRRAGRSPDAWRCLEQALAHRIKHDEAYVEAELYCVKGRLLMACKTCRTLEAEHAFSTAIAVARAQAARLHELRAARDLARVWAEQGERRKAHDLLAPVYGWFTEGFDTTDLIEARRLLDQLA